MEYVRVVSFNLMPIVAGAGRLCRQVLAGLEWVRAVVVKTVTIEEEHPLVHLEVLNVELRHQLNDLDAFNCEPVVALFTSSNIKDRDELGQEVRPELLQGASEPVRLQP